MKFKLLWFFSCVAVITILLSGCASEQRESSSEVPVLSGSETVQAADDSAISDILQSNDNGITGKSMILQIGDSSFTVILESNEAVDAFADMMKDAPIVIQMSDYSGFEKVGSLGTSLPTSNQQTTTQSGDIVLYNGSQIVIFYGSNSWSYTRLGKIDDLSGWEDALGSGDVTVTFSIEK